MVFLLLTVWLVAKEHCNLEAAGWLPDLCTADCGQGTDKDDGCGVVENASYKHSIDQVKASAPILVLCVAVVVVPTEIIPCPLIGPERGTEAQTLIQIWQFVERAAPLSRAPAVA